MTVLLLSASLVAAIFVFMSGDQTIKSGNTASFTCTVDPMLGPANYKVELIGNGVNKVLASGTNAASVFDVPVSVGPADYGTIALNSAKEFDVKCTATETSCDPCCCDSDTETSKLKIYNCPPDAWMCSDSEVRQVWHYTWNGNTCVLSITSEAEHCNDNDGCYAYSTGCEDRDYSCNEGTGSPCIYDYSNRHIDSYNGYVNFCEGSFLKKHRQLHDFYCQATCKDHVSWTDETVVEDCDSKDGWYDNGNSRWIDDGLCKEKQQKEQEERDYTCSASLLSCSYTVTSTRWVDSGSTRNKADGTICATEAGTCEANDVCQSGVCTEEYAPGTALCRAGAGTCDVPEYCTGTNPECPADGKRPDTYICRNSAGVCDVKEYCTGTANDCPTNGFKPSTFECRSANGVCDPGEYCTGSAAACPGNIYAPYNTSCSDGLYCNGNEVCNDVGQCIGGDAVSCAGLNIIKIETCDNNPDNIHYTWDFRSAFTSTCIEANDSCSNGNQSISHQCSKDHCTADCESDADCDDQIAYTTDICLANCTCKHDSNDYCGDGLISGTETCELPNTNNNGNCEQTTTNCIGAKRGLRDTYGNCDASCGCTPDNFIYSCTKDWCGATCSGNSDCADYCDGNIKHFGSTCDLTTSCSCSGGSTLNCDSLDGWYDTGNKRWSNTTVCNEKEQKEQEQRDYACTAGAIVNCTYTTIGTQWIDTGNTKYKANGTSCDDGLWCSDNDVCTEGQCGGTGKICNGFNISLIETCFNSPDNFHFTWDFRHQFVSVCDEDNDRCTTGNETITHTCDKERCGAQCLSDDECYDKDPNTIDTCLEDCTCQYTPIVHKSSSGGGGGGGRSSITTTTNWQCGNWSVCAAEKQTRTCTLNGASKTETQSCKVMPAPVVTETHPSESEESDPVEQTQGSVVTGNIQLKAENADEDITDPVTSVLDKTNSITGAVVNGASTGTMMTGMFLLALAGVFIASLLLRR
ncbi:MAG: hypothetical protein V1866_06435 [archaeon]